MKHSCCWLATLVAALLLAPGQAAQKAPRDSEVEVRALFAEYLRMHAAKEMDRWAGLFLPEAICVRTGSDGRVETYTNMKEFAAGIAQAAKSLESQHETFEDVRVEIDGDAGVYSTLYSLYHNGKKIQQGRVWFSVVRQQGQWKIASFVWYKH